MSGCRHINAGPYISLHCAGGNQTWFKSSRGPYKRDIFVGAKFVNVCGSRKAERNSRREASKCVCGYGTRRNHPGSQSAAGLFGQTFHLSKRKICPNNRSHLTTLSWPQYPRLRKQEIRALRSSPKRGGCRLLYKVCKYSSMPAELWPECPISLR